MLFHAVLIIWGDLYDPLDFPNLGFSCLDIKKFFNPGARRQKFQGFKKYIYIYILKSFLILIFRTRDAKLSNLLTI